ncbi:transcription initiation factor IIB [Halomarina ordinaria]|uniref:Transcription initiation factor IIB n=1 Tax=Halomarina ordinaria TaxID=3033939 RepID=A0ABD5UJA5_9EURY|nr:TFIIB-type zinc ribbon-containing protein [Halomarina sp. PSRA2]
METHIERVREGASSESSRRRSETTGERERDRVDERPDACPECGGRVTTDERRADRSCADCGLVLETERVDPGPEWRTFPEVDDDTRSRVGAPVTGRYHDRGLSTTIGWKDADAFGQTLSGRQRAKMNRLRTWDERFRSKDAHERNLKQALGEVDRMASALGLPRATREVAASLYRTALSNDLLPGRCIEGVASACLYAAARQTESPRGLDELATVSRVERLRIQRAYRYVVRELDLAVAPADPLTYLRRFHSALGFDDEVEHVARDLIEVATDHNVHSGKSPLSLAAGALYAAARLTNTETTQAEVSEASGVSTVTIRDRYREILAVQ